MKTNRQLGIGTGSGASLSVLAQQGVHDIVKTAILATVGAVVSFGLTLLLQRWHRRR